MRGTLEQEGTEESTQTKTLSYMDRGEYDEVTNILKDAGISRKGVEVTRQILNTRITSINEALKQGKRLLQDYEGGIRALTNLEDILEGEVDIPLFIDLGFGSIGIPILGGDLRSLSLTKYCS